MQAWEAHLEADGNRRVMKPFPRDTASTSTSRGRHAKSPPAVGAKAWMVDLKSHTPGLCYPTKVGRGCRSIKDKRGFLPRIIVAKGSASALDTSGRGIYYQGIRWARLPGKLQDEDSRRWSIASERGYEWEVGI
jgi:hypothetical protein